MFHLSKLCRSTKECRHFLVCLELGSPTLARNHPSSTGAAVKGHSQMMSVSRVNLHTHGRRYLVGSLIPHSVFHRFIPNDKLEKHFLLCNSARYKQTTSNKHLLEQVKAKEYTSLYLNRKIKLLHVICNAAKISTVTTIIGAPVFIGASLIDMLPLASALSITGIMASYALFFTAQNYLLLSKIVGKIMISVDETYLKVSHLTVFGKRRDIYVHVSDIIPIPDSLNDKSIHKVQFRNSSLALIFMPKMGGADTNFEVLEMILTGSGLRKEEDATEE